MTRRCEATDWERGSASIWVVAAAALVLAIGFAVTIRTAAVLARHRVELAADLAALAAATGIGVDVDDVARCGQASRVARANGASLVQCQIRLGPDGRSGTAAVRVQLFVDLPLAGHLSASARARAERAPP